MLSAMEAEPHRTLRRAIGIFVLAAATLYWLINVVAPVAEFWAVSATDHVQAMRPISYIERRDPTTCPGFGAEKAECVRLAELSQSDWTATRRALQSMAWDIDRLLWSTLINLGIGLAPLLIVWVNARRTPSVTESELY